MAMKLDSTHPDYDEQKEAYELHRKLYEGGKKIENQEAFLPRHPLETVKQYQIRMDRSCYRNHAKPIVAVFKSAIFRRVPTRKLPKGLEALKENVDMRSTDVDDFFTTVAHNALVEGARFVLVDAPKSEEELTSKADSKRAGIRPYFTELRAADVLDWAFEIKDDGSVVLQYVVIREEVELEAIPFQERKSETRFRLWDREKWQVWRYKESKTAEGKSTPDGGQAQAELVEEGTNPLGEVPVVPFYAERKKAFVGRSIIADIATLCQKVYWKDSEKDKTEFDSCVPILTFFGFSEEELTAFTVSSSNGLRSQSTEAKVGVVEISGESIDKVRTSITDDEKAIREIALRMFRRDSAVGESADAKRIDNQQLHTQIATVSLGFQDSEKNCWILAQKWSSETDGEIEIEYNKDFDLEKATGDLIRAFQELHRDRLISRDTLWEMLVDNEILPADFEAKDELAKLEQESRTGNGPTPNPPKEGEEKEGDQVFEEALNQ